MRIAPLPLLALIPLVISGAAPAAAPVQDAGCANVRNALPAELSGWSDQTPLGAGLKPGDGATIAVGQGAKVSLHPAKHLALAPVPAKGAGEGSGGTLSLAITAAGTYRVALGGPAWVDVVRDGKAIASVAHGHGPKCSGVRKMVDFKLEPGNYAIQLAGSASESLSLLVVKIA